MKAEETKQNVTVNVVVAVLLLVLIGFIAYLFINGANRNAEVESLPPLDVSINRNLEGIAISNNESVALTGCKLTLNNIYSTSVAEITSQAKTYSYDVFTDNDSTRFNIQTTQPEILTISNCEESPERFAAYEW